MHKIGIISTFPPTQCGIATYSYDLVQSVESISQFFQFKKIEVMPNLGHCSIKNFGIQNSEVLQYMKAAEYINMTDIDIVDIQHEFKIFGKPDGENILILLSDIKKPIVTTLHTVSPNLNEQRERILSKIVKRSDMVFVFSKEAKNHLANRYKKQRFKIKVIPHGVPSIKFKQPKQIPERSKFSDSMIFISAGHMRSTKGYEIAIKALSVLKAEIPDFRYLILGANHPENEAAQSYRQYLLNLAAELKLKDQVIFIDEYLERKELINYIQLADICLLPYTRIDQSSSGVLALMLACGRPIVSTPFQFARSHLNGLSGAVSNSFNYIDFLEATRDVINRNDYWNNMSKYNYSLGKKWNWEKVGREYSFVYANIINKQKFR